MVNSRLPAGEGLQQLRFNIQSKMFILLFADEGIDYLFMNFGIRLVGDFVHISVLSGEILCWYEIGLLSYHRWS